MGEEFQRTCPECNTERDFYLAASTNLHLGKKTKWRCPECDYGFVQIDGILDSPSDASA